MLYKNIDSLHLNRLPRLVLIILISSFLLSCETVEDIVREPLTDEDIMRLQHVETQMLQGHTAEVRIDRKISEAVKQMVHTLKPEYRSPVLGKYKLGFLEISDIDRRTVTKLHNYITEKTLTFSFLQPMIANNFTIVERFLLKEVNRELELENIASPVMVDQCLAQTLGKVYDLDIIETGVVTLSDDYIDLNLRLIETTRGRIIAVGAAKIEHDELTRRWLREAGGVGVGWPEMKKRRR